MFPPMRQSSESGRVRAAMYLRASTESQNYSTRHQRRAVEEFANSNGLVVVNEYVDEGKSGLDIRRRNGLRDLMADVQSGCASFEVIVVYDVSRWGRFQDVDEAGYHEHTCRRAGIKVLYCAEQFQNDGSPLSSLLKAVKRTMAAEYSRELSAKVFKAQWNFVEMGFKQGGHAGYGLRRLSVAANGAARRELKFGEAKATATDRVILVLGPDDEVATVRRVYRLYIEERASEASIARLLNFEGVLSEFGRPWTQAMVNSILTNEKYVGRLVFNRRSSKLSSRRHRNDPDEWLIKDGAVPGILDRSIFDQAQEERNRRNRRYGRDELAELLRCCYARNGKITATIIGADDLLPDVQIFSRAFGSLAAAYDAAGLPRTKRHNFVEAKKRIQPVHDRLFEAVCAAASAAGAEIIALREERILILDGATVVKVVATLGSTPVRGRRYWRVPHAPGVDFTIVGRFENDASPALDFCLITASQFDGRQIYLQDTNNQRFDGVRRSSFKALFGVEPADGERLDALVAGA